LAACFDAPDGDRAARSAAPKANAPGVASARRVSGLHSHSLCLRMARYSNRRASNGPTLAARLDGK
jgi:hypothetical protein